MVTPEILTKQECTFEFADMDFTAKAACLAELVPL